MPILRGNTEIANALDCVGITLAPVAEQQRGLGRLEESAREEEILPNMVVFLLHQGDI